MSSEDAKPQNHGWADHAGIWLSFLCLIHCFGTVILLLFLPALATYLAGEKLHVVLAVVLPALALLAFWPGFRRHGDWRVVSMGLVGVALISVGAWLGALLPLWGEASITTCGSLALIWAHWRNRQLGVRT